MPIASQIGLATKVLELAATSIGAGIVVGGFVAAGLGVIRGQSRGEVEGKALTHTFGGGIVGMLCLCFDLLVR